jgi:hypothetical protein
MAFGTLHFKMFTLEYEGGPGMIETRRRFPARVGMALQAVLPHLSPMLILVAVQAGGIEPQECPVKVFIGVQEFFIPLNMIRFVAFPAIEAVVLALQTVPGCGVIEVIDTVWPPDQFTVPAQMLHVAGNAIVVALILMQALTACDTLV